MKTLLKIFSLFVFFFPIKVLFLSIDGMDLYAQSITWQKYYDNNNRADIGNEVVQTFDGGFAIAGLTSAQSGGNNQDILLLKINYNGDLEWKKNLGDVSIVEKASSIKQMNDSGFVLTGVKGNSMLLLRTDKQGNIIWSKIFQEPNAETNGFSVSLTNDNGFIICGDIFFPSLFINSAYVVKTDSLGNLQWKKTYSDVLQAHSIIQDSGNNFYFAGQQIIKKLDVMGDAIWTRIFSSINLTSLTQKSSNEIFSGGNNGLLSMYLIRFDSTGFIEWERNIFPNASCNSICWNNSTVVMAGSIWNNGGDVAFTKVDFEGNQILKRMITSGGTSGDWANSIKTTKDSGFIITGATEFAGTALAPNVLAIKTDSNGNAPVIVNVKKNTSYLDNFKLYQNFPNPFNPVTKINYSISNTQYTILKVYDVLGNEIATLVNKKQNAGNYEIEFDGSNFPSGIYFYTLRTENYSDAKSMILLK